MESEETFNDGEERYPSRKPVPRVFSNSGPGITQRGFDPTRTVLFGKTPIDPVEHAPPFRSLAASAAIAALQQVAPMPFAQTLTDQAALVAFVNSLAPGAGTTYFQPVFNDENLERQTLQQAINTLITTLQSS